MGLAENLGIPSLQRTMTCCTCFQMILVIFIFLGPCRPKRFLVLYKVEYESAPVKIRPSSVRELKEIASLPLRGDNTASVSNLQPTDTGPAIPDSVLQKTREYTAHYAELTRTVRNLKNRVKEHENVLDSLRKRYGSLSIEEERALLANTIREEEFVLIELQQSLRDARKSTQAIEDMFLSTECCPHCPCRF